MISSVPLPSPTKTQQWAQGGAAVSEAEPRAGPRCGVLMASSARETSRPNDPPWLDSGNSFNPEMVRPPAARHSHRGRQGDPAGGW